MIIAEVPHVMEHLCRGGGMPLDDRESFVRLHGRSTACFRPLKASATGEQLMGAWAEDTFGNDTACDWIGTFLENPGLPAVKAAIETVLDTDDYLDSDEACDCLAACEVIARLEGKWGLRNEYSKKLDQWVEANPTAVPDDLKIAADAAIERILGPNSELPELWDEGGRNEDWHKAMDDLRERIRG